MNKKNKQFNIKAFIIIVPLLLAVYTLFLGIYIISKTTNLVPAMVMKPIEDFAVVDVEASTSERLESVIDKPNMDLKETDYNFISHENTLVKVNDNYSFDYIIEEPVKEVVMEDLVTDILAPDDGIEKKYIAITFDDGPNDLNTPILLDILKELNVKATFFLVGNRVQKFPELTKRIYDEGHEIGNHTFEHKDLSKLNIEGISYQIDITNEIIKEITTEDVTIMRPSYGARNEKVLSEIAKRQMTTVLWNIDPNDWKSKDSNAISQHIIKMAKPGDIILLHDIYHSSVEAAKLAITELQKAGFEFVTVSELIELNGGIETGGVYRSGRGAVK